MKNITGDKMLVYIDRVFGDKKPITADIFLNNYCNNNCPYCTYKRWELDSGSRYMSFEDFVRYTNRLLDLGVQGFILTGGGEPTISKDFERIVGWLDSNKIKYGINTNFNKYVFCNPRYLKVSLDAWNEDSYYDKRGVRRYRLVRKNISDFAKHKSPNTKLGIQLLAKTVDEVYKFYEGNKDLPVDYISIRPMESTGCEYYKNLLPEQVNMAPNNIITAINQIHSLDDRVILNYKWNLLTTTQDSCTAQWAQVAVNEIGEVMYCCHKPYQIVGHIMDNDILEKKAKVGTNMMTCDVPCRMTGPNYEVNKIISAKSDVEFI